ncbi:DUF6239 family natural product biosynthesis protein [Amycolatopsis suaedae]|uniref:Uncharacterized protein n=1 Tax=Amycolatopsis suaedae TaxID=2510978 RepID=A0A4Q7J9C0_9PSEU|nr:DUF6239 family natural product biosynthesis protein [Amycolatopsis suaedae]RZQ63817.1 hypothetical protein EWH70_11685 [Amycolatopsis suaedae]
MILEIAQGHDHVVTSPIDIGPAILRVTLLAAVPVVAGGALLRVFLTGADRAATAAVAVLGTAAVVAVLLLADGLDLPQQFVVLVLAVTGSTLWAAFAAPDRFATALHRLRRAAPWVLALTAAAALTEFGRAWLGQWDRATLTTLLHTGLLIGLPGLCCAALCRPRTVRGGLAVHVPAATLATAVTAAAAHAITLTL